MNDLYSTSDTALATSIIASGIPVEHMERKGDGRVYFYFCEELDVSPIANRFWAKSLQVDAQTILTEFKILKQRISNL